MSSTLRPLHAGMRGADVRAAQRALRAALLEHGLAPANRTSGFYGEGTVADCIRFELRVAKLAHPDGRLDSETWAHLLPFVDAYGKWLLKRAPKPPAQTDYARSLVVHFLLVLLATAPRRYAQERPYPKSLEAWRMRGSDCSGSGELAWWLANETSLRERHLAIRDPNATNYDGTGWTQSQDKRGRHVEEITVRGAEGSFYEWPSGHVTWELGDGSVFSHGSPGGPRRLPRHYRPDYAQTRDYLPPS